MDIGGQGTGKLFQKTSKAICLSFVLILLPLLVVAQRTESAQPVVNVAAVISPRHIQLGEKARLDLTISGETFIKHIEAPQFNFLPAFLAVPLRSETTPRLESNQIAVSMAWAYELIPQAVGDFALSDIRFAYQGNSYFANPGSIRVSGTDTYVDNATSSVHKVEAEVDTSTPYLNAPLTYTFRYLYTAVLPTRESPTPVLPSFRDFLVEESATLPPQTQQIRGQTFWVEEHVRQLYPKKMGQVVIEPAALILPLRRGRKTLKTKPLKLAVQPLPKVGKPLNFSGAIGVYKISAQATRGAVEVGKALTLSVRISGRGNIQTVTAPKLPPMAGVVVNGPNLVEDATPMSRVYAYALIPAQTGALRIPAIKYIYFDPNRSVYATTETIPIPISVRPNPNNIAEDTESSPWMIWLIVSAVLLAVLAVGGYLWYRSGFAIPTKARVDNPTGTSTPASGASKQKTQSTEGEPVTPVSQAHDALAVLANSDTTDNATPFANTLAQTLYQYLEDTFALSERNADTAREVCVHAQVSEAIVEELVDLLTKCDYHRFAPVPLTSEERNGLIARVAGVINDIENHQNVHDT